MSRVNYVKSQLWKYQLCYDSDSQAQLCQFQLCKYQLCARREICHLDDYMVLHDHIVLHDYMVLHDYLAGKSRYVRNFEAKKSGKEWIFKQNYQGTSFAKKIAVSWYH